MKAIWRDVVWRVAGDDGDQVLLETVDGDGIVHVPYSDPTLIIDPTDREVAGARGRVDVWEIYGPAGYLHRAAVQDADRAGRHYCSILTRYQTS